ncbi:unnamed protein product [Amoebophrya sp. A120]|nr:unnamed protein product [Amoebophrya sp. A120]|eukprot:GSA120T00024549001.1
MLRKFVMHLYECDTFAMHSVLRIAISTYTTSTLVVSPPSSRQCRERGKNQRAAAITAAEEHNWKRQRKPQDKRSASCPAEHGRQDERG